jgi:hypothetical protein
MDRGFSMTATRDMQPTAAGASNEDEGERRSRTPDSRDSDDSDIDYRRRPIHPPFPALEGKITGNVVRVLTFTPRERRGYSHRKKDAIVNTRLLLYQNDRFEVIKPDRIFLNQECKFSVPFWQSLVADNVCQSLMALSSTSLPTAMSVIACQGLWETVAASFWISMTISAGSSGGRVGSALFHVRGSG